MVEVVLVVLGGCVKVVCKFGVVVVGLMWVFVGYYFGIVVGVYLVS